ncbi:MAG: hypothetical protein ACR2PY_01500 [Salinispira sp.]
MLVKCPESSCVAKVLTEAEKCSECGHVVTEQERQEMKAVAQFNTISGICATAGLLSILLFNLLQQRQIFAILSGVLYAAAILTFIVSRMRISRYRRK